MTATFHKQNPSENKYGNFDDGDSFSEKSEKQDKLIHYSVNTLRHMTEASNKWLSKLISFNVFDPNVTEFENNLMLKIHITTK